nr:unnamed protein product [Callosobruchus analis]
MKLITFTITTLTKFNDRPITTQPLGMRCRELGDNFSWIISQPKVNLEYTLRNIYTDRSKSNSGVGVVEVGEGEIWKGSLNVMSSIYTAELTALYQALRYVNQNSSGSFLICLNFSSLQSIRDIFSIDPMDMLEYQEIKLRCTLCNCKCLT